MAGRTICAALCAVLLMSATAAAAPKPKPTPTPTATPSGGQDVTVTAPTPCCGYSIYDEVPVEAWVQIDGGGTLPAGITLTQRVPAGVHVLRLDPKCARDGDTITCHLDGGRTYEGVEHGFQARTPGSYSMTTTVTGPQRDPDLSDNQVTSGLGSSDDGSVARCSAGTDPMLLKTGDAVWPGGTRTDISACVDGAHVWRTGEQADLSLWAMGGVSLVEGSVCEAGGACQTFKALAGGGRTVAPLEVAVDLRPGLWTLSLKVTQPGGQAGYRHSGICTGPSCWYPGTYVETHAAGGWVYATLQRR